MLDVVLTQSGADLQIHLHGGTDVLTVSNWYSATSNHIEKLTSQNGKQLANTQVDQLIQAMATFSANNGGITWEQAIDTRPQDVQAVIAAYWQAA